MGCDIHYYIDYSPFPDNPSYTHCLCQFFGMRYYYLFGLLAGVRGKEPALFPPKGLPKNISFRVEDDVFENDDGTGLVIDKNYHTHSWLTMEELKRVIRRYKKLYGIQPGCDIIAIYKCMEVLEKEKKNPRLVFWFDN